MNHICLSHISYLSYHILHTYVLHTSIAGDNDIICIRIYSHRFYLRHLAFRQKRELYVKGRQGRITSENKNSSTLLIRSNHTNLWPFTFALSHHSEIRALNVWLFVTVLRKHNSPLQKACAGKRASRYFNALHGQVNRHTVDFPVLICMTLDLGKKKKKEKKVTSYLHEWARTEAIKMIQRWLKMWHSTTDGTLRGRFKVSPSALFLLWSCVFSASDWRAMAQRTFNNCWPLRWMIQ